MLMNEIASAADTLELWKLVNDSVWASLQQLQKAEQEREAAAKKAAAKRVPSKRGISNPRVAQSKPQQRSPQSALHSQASTVQAPMPQQMARAAAVRPLPAQDSEQPQTQLS
jgi:hypothetical protein